MYAYTRTQAPDCIWKQAGVVARKQCFKDFYCQDCRFDRAMLGLCQQPDRTPKTRHFVLWQEKLKQKPVQARPCIHHMKGRISFRTCNQSYRCGNCEFDQYFQDCFRVCARLSPRGYDRIRGYAFPSGYYLSSAHVWVSLQEGSRVSIGVDDFICRALGHFGTISLPLTGQPLTQGEPAFALGRQDSEILFPSPLTGVVTGANPLALSAPEKISMAPYTEGWLFTLACESLGMQIRELLFLESAADFLVRAAEDLDRFLAKVPELAAADGGEPVAYPGQFLSSGTWKTLARELTGQG